MLERWGSHAYGFFDPRPAVKEIQGRRAHVFRCSATICRGSTRNVNRFLNTGDVSSTSNLLKHATKCFGHEAVDRARNNKLSAEQVRANIVKATTSESINKYFKATSKNTVTYSHRQLTASETRCEFVRWCAESYRPFEIVKDTHLQVILKSGRPGFMVPSPSTVARDTKLLFARTRRRLRRLLCDYDGRLSIATDCWTSPNGHALMAITVHVVHENAPMCLVLDIVEIPKVYNLIC
ncbi:uncharacterized protein BXZ73DRAFT_55587 [Epithele typhae]|uniref:uncharacterized protein n=1 Tax=Epithele typhae TaxID=378194 RepID=UPI002008C005|nr:uncharacterized protein BXZ73DRAFT_56171 [Epithele typhae]XP_047872203.1 uncharacterized protein BXZ73DRAFT_55587 [Epithele typhae]KAH9912530.1 hypothetical protein BXZ73DRAFT_56171 [Epithele typhae]KAH9913349.1 hypothetical protein BXZ73DRAFT_55587 [Epithele typhae]